MKKRIHSLRTKIILCATFTMLFVITLSIVVLFSLLTHFLSSYIQDNIDFTLEQTISNLASKGDYMEGMLLRIRKDDAMMEKLVKGEIKRSDNKQLLKLADIYSESNISLTQTPFIEALYLFDSQGNYTSLFFSELNEQEKVSYDEKILESYQKDATLTGIVTTRSEEDLFISASIYGQTMLKIGTLVMAINPDSIYSLLSVLSTYKTYLYSLTDTDDNVVFGYPDIEVAQKLRIYPNDKPQDIKIGRDAFRLYCGSIGLGHNLCIAISKEQVSYLMFSSVSNYFIVLLLLLIIAEIFLVVWLIKLTRPLSDVVESLSKVSKRDFEVRLPKYGSKEFDLISDTFNEMTSQIGTLIQDVYESDLIATRNELQFLQSQMNPHFMYNVLNTLALKATLDGNDEIASITNDFSRLIQARLQQKGNTKITIREELQLVNFYLNLQKYRFEEKLNYNILVSSPSLYDYYIPRLIIEFAVENAVVHGIEPKESSGEVTICVEEVEKEIVITVKDDGIGFKEEAGYIILPLEEPKEKQVNHNHIAINNVYKLLKHTYLGKAKMCLWSKRNYGTIVTIRLPKEQNDVLCDSNR